MILISDVFRRKLTFLISGRFNIKARLEIALSCLDSMGHKRLISLRARLSHRNAVTHYCYCITRTATDRLSNCTASCIIIHAEQVWKSGKTNLGIKVCNRRHVIQGWKFGHSQGHGQVQNVTLSIVWLVFADIGQPWNVVKTSFNFLCVFITMKIFISNESYSFNSVNHFSNGKDAEC